MRPKPAQLSVIAVAALAIFAVAAFALMAGNGTAPATASTLDGVSGGHLPQDRPSNPPPPPPPDPTPEPTLPPVKTPEACAGYPAEVVFDGHYALFDVYWDDVEKELVNNPCPPSVSHAGAAAAATMYTTAQTTRRSSDIKLSSDPNVKSTVIHIHDELKETIAANNDADYAKYPYLYRHAEDGDDEGTDITGNEIGAPLNTTVWHLPACTGNDPNPWPNDTLCLGFSTGLLRADAWDDTPDTMDGDTCEIQYELESLREDNHLALADRGLVFITGRSCNNAQPGLIWDSINPDINEFKLATGQYAHAGFTFTQLGTYVLQVHVKAHPSQLLKDAAPAGTVPHEAKTDTSEVIRYKLHVGLHADLKVDVQATAKDANDATLDPGDDVTITVTASNPSDNAEDATNTKVDVTLPDGLTYRSHNAPEGTTYDSTAGTWTIGTLHAADAPRVLTITARVAPNTRGQDLETSAHIYATESIGSSTRVELDSHTADNTATASVTVHFIPNRPPMALFKCSVDEESAAGASVCTVLVKDADGDSPLTYALKGDGAGNFIVSAVDDGASITVKGNSYLNHEDPEADSFDVTLQVSDGKNELGNPDDNAVDTSVAVEITIDDVAEGTPVTLTAPSAATIGSTIRLSASMINPPNQAFHYIWVGRPQGGEIDWREETGVTSQVNVTYSGDAGAREYAVFVRYTDHSGSGVQETFDSAWKRVDWNEDG